MLKEEFTQAFRDSMAEKSIAADERTLMDQVDALNKTWQRRWKQCNPHADEYAREVATDLIRRLICIRLYRELSEMLADESRHADMRQAEYWEMEDQRDSIRRHRDDVWARIRRVMEDVEETAKEKHPDLYECIR